VISRRTAYILGELAFTLGLVVLLFAAYEFFGSSWAVDRAQSDLDSRLDRRWAAGMPPVPGQPASRLYIPRLHKKWAVVEGVTQADLAKGPGHYPKTGAPGDVGNVGIAGHRLPAVFWNLDRLRRGDPVIVESRSGWFVYRVVRLRVVRPTQVEVVAPNPDRPGRPAIRRLLTLTTCNPKFDNYQRLVVVAELSREQGKRAGRPAELGQ
jgi:sortase A